VTRRLERATTRRRFVQGLAAGGVLASAGAWRPRRAALAASADVASLPGPLIDLAIGAHQVNFTGETRTATRERHAARSDPALAGGRRRDAVRAQRPRRRHDDPLARRADPLGSSPAYSCAFIGELQQRRATKRGDSADRV